MTTSHQGACFCGAVQLEVSGEPVAMAYCHCESCRSWSGSPVHGSTMWNADSVKVTSGSDHIATFHKTPESISHRKYCTKCGGHLMISHPSFGQIDVLPATLPSLKFSPSVHVNYGESVLAIDDGLPKFRDFPVEFGGFGELVS